MKLALAKTRSIINYLKFSFMNAFLMLFYFSALYWKMFGKTSRKEKSRALKTLEIKPTSQRWKPIDKFLKTKSPN
jgi:hypothetical protein